MNGKIALWFSVIAILIASVGELLASQRQSTLALPPIHHVAKNPPSTPTLPASTPTPQPSAPAPQLPAAPTPQTGLYLGGCSSIVPSSTIAVNSVVQHSAVPGWNAAILPLQGYKVSGYCFLYPADWQVRVAGAEAMNLAFNESIATGTRQNLFVQVAQGTWPLEQADKATYSYEESGPYPFVGPSETIVRKEIEMIGDKQALFESSENGSTTVINRYFLEDAGGVYMFRSQIDKDLASSTAYGQFLQTLKQVVSSTRFVQ